MGMLIVELDYNLGLVQCLCQTRRQTYIGILFSSCLFVHLLPNLWTRYFEKEWTDIAASLYRLFTGQGLET